MEKLKNTILLILITIIWGMSFTIIKASLQNVPPLTFVALRFLSGAGVLLIGTLIFQRQWFKFSKEDWLAGMTIGFFLFSGYIAQTVGISKTSASNAAFITGLCVIFVPLIMRFTGHKISLFSWLGVILSFIGVGFISLSDQLTINPGDAIVGLCALLFGFQIFYVSKFSAKFSVVNITLIQVAVCGVLSGVTAFLFEDPMLVIRNMNSLGFNGLLFCAIPGTAFAYIVQNYAQKNTSPERAALIFSFEPVFGAFFAFLIAREHMSLRACIGAVLMFIAMLITDLGPYLQKNYSKT